jgi:hypothetical protein
MKTFLHLWQQLLTMTNVSNKIRREKSKHTYHIPFFPPENRTVYEEIPKDMLEPERTQTIWRLRVAFWISKFTRAKIHACDRAPTHRHTHTHTETCNTSCFPRKQWFRERASMSCYSYTASLVISVLPYTFRFTIRQSRYHETLYNMSY